MKLHFKLKNKKKALIISICIIVIVAILITTLFIVNKMRNKAPQETASNNEIVESISFSDSNDGTNAEAIGYLTIETLGLKDVPVKEGTDMNTLNRYLGHFSDSAFLEGNVAIAGHNRGYEKNYFENLKDIKSGAIILYKTKFETKVYQVTEMKEISEDNVEVIANTPDNKITLITCVENKPKLRLCVVGTEIN